jgi:membrane peptidoglycan carboxypeptidase
VASGTTSRSTRDDDYVPRHAPARAHKRASKRRVENRSFLRRRWILLVVLTPFVLSLLGFLGLLIAYARIQLPDKLPPIQTSYLYDRDGELLAALHGAVDRDIKPLSEMSEHIKQAVIATEDHDFYSHPGVDPIGIVRAAWTDIVQRDTVQGASTITQQLVKNVYAGNYVTDPETGLQDYVVPERSVEQKAREILLAVKLERELGKDKILAQYLNTVYFGHGAYGVQAAAQTYFGKDAIKLTVNESAVLAGTLHAPELYDPIDRPYDNAFRRDYTIDQMVAYGFLDATTAAKIKKHDCCGIPQEILDADTTERIHAPEGSKAEYFVDYVRQDLLRRDGYGSARVYGGGLRVTTTLDLDLQRAAVQAVETHLPDAATDPSASLVSIDPTNGEILAMYGGRDWSKSKLNLATFRGGSGRQAGSAFKAFTLAAAMRAGYGLDQYWYGPSTLPIPECADPESDDGVWHPVNAEGSGSGTLLSATAHSVNTVFAQLIAQLGPENVVDAAEDLGIRSRVSPVCAITLGSVAVNPLEMTNAYATLAARGVRHWATPYLQVAFPSSRTDPDVRPPPEGTQVLDQNDADLVTYALEGVVEDGTGTSAAIPPYYIAGKTGTANENVDAWFCGYTVQVATCVWVGYPKGEIPLENVQGVPLVYGGTIPAEIWRDYMEAALSDTDPVPFPEPSFDGYTVGPETPAYAPPSYSSPTAEPTSAPPEPTATAEPTKTPEPTDSPEPTRTPEPTDPPSPTNSPAALRRFASSRGS